MSALAWIILMILILPPIGLLVWMGSWPRRLIHVPSSKSGPGDATGKVTDRILLPGSHFLFD